VHAPGWRGLGRLRCCLATVKLSFTRRGRRRNVAAGGLQIRAHAGANTVAFAGRLSHGRRLSAGSYRLTATPTDDAHHTGASKTAALRIT
jgi:hypothetical protein